MSTARLVNEPEKGSRLDSQLLPHDDDTSAWLTAFGYFLFVCLGVAPQLLQNALYAETPIFIHQLAEKKAISAHIIAAFMVANVAGLLYLIVTAFKKIPYKASILVIFAVSIVDAVMCALFWDHSLTIVGNQLSFVILLVAFVAGATGNTSVIIFYGFASRYRPIYTTALSAGYGLSGLVPSLLTLVQNTGAALPEIPLFDARIWFFITAALIIIFSLSYLFILQLDWMTDPAQLQVDHEEQHSVFFAKDAEQDEAEKSSNFKIILHNLAIMVVSSVFAFWMPGAFPFLAQNQELVWLNNIFLVVPTLGAFVAAFTGPIYRAHKIVPWICVLLQVGAFVYLLLILLRATHLLVPGPTWLVFVLSFLFVFICGHNSTMVYMLLRNQVKQSYVQRAQQWAGFSYQVGATIGIFANIGCVHGGLYWERMDS